MKLPPDLPPGVPDRDSERIRRLRQRNELDSLQKKNIQQRTEISRNVWLQGAVQPLIKLDRLTDGMMQSIDKSMWK
jgi:hypothetical protein